MAPFPRVGFALWLTALVAIVPAGAQEGLTRRDLQGPVTVTVTLTTPPTPGAPLRAKIVLDTHSAALDGVALEQAVALRAPDGADVAPVAVEQATGGGHHREAVVVFPPRTGSGALWIVVRGVGGVAERRFVWE